MALANEYQMMLEENGIKSFIHEDNLSLESFSSGSCGQQISLFIEDEDYEKALAVITATNKGKNEFLPWCPECGNEEVERITDFPKHGPYWVLILSVIVIIAFILLFIYLRLIPGIIVIAILSSTLYYWFKPYKREKFRCLKCGHQFHKY